MSENKTFSHPRPIYLLSFVISCEMFSYYCMRNILLYYLVEGPMQIKESVALGMTGTFVSLFFALQFIGGIIADKLIGMRLAVYFGLLTMGIGHVFLSLPFQGFFVLGLGTLVVGAAFIRITSVVMFGACYEKNDHRRVQDFTLLYTMSYIAIFFAALLPEKIARTFGWHYGFGLAAIVLWLGLLIYYMKHKVVENIGNSSKKISLNTWALIIISSIIAAFAFGYIINNSHLYKYIITIISITAALYLIRIAIKTSNTRAMLKLAIAIIGCVIIYTLVDQVYFSFMLFAKRNVHKIIEFNLFNNSYQLELTNTMLITFNPLAIIIFGVILSKIWKRLSLRNMDPSNIRKMVFGPLIATIGLTLLYFTTFTADSNGYIPYYYAITAVFLLSCAELFGQPIGYAIFTNYSPPQYVGILLGIFKLSFGIQSFLSAQLSKIMAIDDNNVTAQASLLIYRNGFYNLVILACTMLVGFYLLVYLTERYLKPIKMDTSQK